MKIRLPLLLSALLGFSLTTAAQQGTLIVQPPVNSASFVFDLPRGGALATLFVVGLTGKPGLLVAPSSSPLPFQLGGVQVTVNGALAPILAVLIPDPASSAPGLINFQVPLERNAVGTGSLDPVGKLTVNAPGAGQVERSVITNPHGGFFQYANGYAIAQHASDLSQVTVQNPAHPGETIIVYGNDFFQVWPPPPIGIPVPSQPLFQVDTSGQLSGLPDLFLQGYPNNPIPGRSCATTTPLSVPFAGLAPGLVGVEQLKIVVPGSQGPGDWPLFFSVVCHDLGEGISSPYVLVPVR